MYCTFSLSFESSIVFQKIVYFAFMYVCIHWLMGGWTYWLCVCVWIQATLGTQRTACKSLLSFHHVGFRGQTQVIGLGSTDAYPLVYCVCFFLLLHASSWCILSVPLLLTEMIHSFKKILLSFSSQSIRPQPLALPFFLCAHLPKYIWPN